MLVSAVLVSAGLERQTHKQHSFGLVFLNLACSVPGLEVEVFYSTVIVREHNHRVRRNLQYNWEMSSSMEMSSSTNPPPEAGMDISAQQAAPAVFVSGFADGLQDNSKKTIFDKAEEFLVKELLATHPADGKAAEDPVRHKMELRKEAERLLKNFSFAHAQKPYHGFMLFGGYLQGSVGTQQLGMTTPSAPRDAIGALLAVFGKQDTIATTDRARRGRELAADLQLLPLFESSPTGAKPMSYWQAGWLVPGDVYILSDSETDEILHCGVIAEVDQHRVPFSLEWASDLGGGGKRQLGFLVSEETQKLPRSTGVLSALGKETKTTVRVYAPPAVVRRDAWWHRAGLRRWRMDALEKAKEGRCAYCAKRKARIQ